MKEYKIMLKEDSRWRIGRITKSVCISVFFGICFGMVCVGVGGCSARGDSAKKDSANVAMQPSADSAAMQRDGRRHGNGQIEPPKRPEGEVRDVTLFGVKTKSLESDVVRDLAAAGILKVDEISEKNGEFQNAIVEFGGVKFALNGGFTFITSRHDKKAIKGLIKEISKYYGEPEVDGYDEPQYNYYHWNLYKQNPDAPYIRIRPVHSEEGGLTMMWDL